MRLTEKQIIILEALARFKYLTSQQLQIIFTSKSTSSINTAIRSLKSFKYPLIKSLSFWITPWHGKLPHIHFLTSAGIKVLVEQLSIPLHKIYAPTNRNSFFQRDYFHRISTITFNILFQRWLINQGHQLYFFKSYFNRPKHENGHKAETTITNWEYKSEPDAIGLYFANTQPHLFLFEQHNGVDAKRAINQITHHCYGLANGAASEQFKLNKPLKIYYVFEYESCLKATLNHFENDKWLMKFRGHFYFKTNQSLISNFADNWQKPWSKSATQFCSLQ